MSFRDHRSRLLVLAVTTTAAVGASLVSVPSAAAAPAAPALESPLGGATVDTNSPAFSWQRVAGATKYEVTVDDDPNFGSPSAKVQTTNDRWVPSTPLPNGAQYWQVRAAGTDGTWGAATGTHFTIAQHSGPAHIGPADGTVLAQPGQPPVLSWAHVPGAQSYTVEVARDAAFTIGVAQPQTTSNTSYVVPTQVADGTYYWRVRATFATGIASQPSNPWSYTVGPLQQVAGATPDDPTTGHEDVVLDWDPVPGAKYYNIWVSADDDMTNTTARVVDERTVVYGTRFSPPNNLELRQFYWKVRAVNAHDEAIDWDSVETHIFKHSWNDAPQLLAPADGALVGDPLHFQWTPVQHATSYQLEVSANSSFTTYSTCTTAATTYAPGYLNDDCMPAQLATVYWRVRAIDAPANIPGLYSEIRSLRYEPEPVTLLSPAAGATVAVPTLKWAAAQDAHKYRVEVTGTGGGNASTETFSLSWTPNLDPVHSPFSWRVVALDANGRDGVRYPMRSFTLAGSPATSGLPPLTPTSGVTTTTRFPTLTWEPWPGADHYTLCIGTHNTGTCDNTGSDSILTTKLKYPAATSTDNFYLRPGSYDWAATARDSGGNALGRGTFGTFVITDLDAVTGQQIALDGNSLDSGAGCTTSVASGICADAPATPVFSWDPVPGAGFYKIFVSKERNLQNLVWGTAISNVPGTVNTRWTPRLGHNPSQLADATAGQPYYWYVLPCKDAQNCNANPIGVADVATNAFSKKSPSPEPASPGGPVGSAGYADVVANDVTFSWRDYERTNADSVWRDPSQRSYQTAWRYRFQVSTQDSFASSTTSTYLVDQATITPTDKLLPEGRLFWRVQAIDAEGNALTWSPTWSFVKSSPKPALTSPVGAVTIPGAAVFRWQPTEFAAAYRVRVYANGDLSSTPVVNATTNQAAYAPPKPLAASPQPYVWRVERQDGAGGWGGMPEHTGSFYVLSAAADQRYPASDATLLGNDVHFAWNQVQGASRYRLEYRRNTATSGATVVTSALEHAPLGTIDGGSYLWRVTALDAAGVPLATDATWRALTVVGVTAPGGPGVVTPVPNPRPTIAAVAPRVGAKVKPGVAFRITFSEPVTGVSRSTVNIKLNGTTVKARVTLSADLRTVTLKPKKTLKRKRTYKITLTSGIRDLSGLSFTTRSWSVKVK